MSSPTIPIPAKVLAAETSEIAPALLTERQAAALLNIGARTLWRHARSGKVPGLRRIGASVRYDRLELEDWIRRGCPVGGRGA